MQRTTVKVTVEDGDHFTTTINLDFAGAQAYYRDYVMVTENDLTGEETRRSVVSVEDVTQPKGIIISVYRDARGGDCTNGGQSSQVKQFTLIGNGIAEIFEANETAPAIRIVNHPTVKGYQFLVPQTLIDSGKWTMMGGNFGWSSDSRIGRVFGGRPMPIHDRVEN